MGDSHPSLYPGESRVGPQRIEQRVEEVLRQEDVPHVDGAVQILEPTIELALPGVGQRERERTGAALGPPLLQLRGLGGPAYQLGLGQGVQADACRRRPVRALL